MQRSLRRDAYLRFEAEGLDISAARVGRILPFDAGYDRPQSEVYFGLRGCPIELLLFRKFRQQRFKRPQQFRGTRSRDLKYLPLIECGIAMRENISEAYDEIPIGHALK